MKNNKSAAFILGYIKIMRLGLSSRDFTYVVMVLFLKQCFFAVYRFLLVCVYYLRYVKGFPTCRNKKEPATNDMI